MPFIHSLVTFFFKFAFADRSTVSRKLSLVVFATGLAALHLTVPPLELALGQ